MTNKNPFVKWVLHGIEIPLHQNLIYWLSPTAALEQSLRAIWDAASGAAVLILPQTKLNSQLSSCASFLSWQEVDKKSGVPEEEKGVWGSQGGEKGNFFSLQNFVLVNITMDLAWGHVSPSWDPSD